MSEGVLVPVQDATGSTGARVDKAGAIIGSSHRTNRLRPPEPQSIFKYFSPACFSRVPLL
jgi:hypothetical protein